MSAVDLPEVHPTRFKLGWVSQPPEDHLTGQRLPHKSPCTVYVALTSDLKAGSINTGNEWEHSNAERTSERPGV